MYQMYVCLSFLLGPLPCADDLEALCRRHWQELALQPECHCHNVTKGL